MNPEIQKKLRRNSVHPTTLAERQDRFRQACIINHEANSGLGRMKRTIRQLKHKGAKPEQ